MFNILRKEDVYMMTFADKVPPNTGNKKKINYAELASVLHSVGNSYVEFKRCKYKGMYDGTIYRLARPLTPEQIAWFEKWLNCAVTEGSYKYAPEIKAHAVFLADKVFK